MLLTGQCLCGEIKYQVTGHLPSSDGNTPLPVMCHCRYCQRQTGSAFSAVTMAPLTQFTVLNGEQLIARFESSPGNYRCFCSACGSMLFYEQSAEPEIIYFSLGTVDDCTLKPQSHAFMGSKAAWYEVNDDLPKFEKYPE